MGFLTRLLKTPDEDQEEGPDEFNAEQNGLLMAPSAPSDAEAPTEEGGLASPPAQGEAKAAQDEVAEPSEGEVEPLSLTDQSPPVQDQAQAAVPEDPETVEAVADEVQAEQASSDDTLSLFRTTVVTQCDLPSVLREGLEDIAAADLLAEARSIRDSLLGKGAAGGKQRSEEAA
jgi:hypothetical protein